MKYVLSTKDNRQQYSMASTRQRPSPSSDSDADSDNSVTGADDIRSTDLSDTIFKSYLQITGRSSPDLSKIQAFLTSSRSGALSCLICLERIKLSHPTWSCSSGCFAVFHLLCIQSWARQASDLAAERAITRLSREHFPVAAANALESSVWNCPKCRVEYSKSQIPKTYLCFCGKLDNPPSDPWILPHSCGEICGRPLKYNCGHECLLLCHPGPCPSCPKLVKSRCFCGAVEDVRRCGFKNFSCNGVCSKFLDCGTHRCSEVCHEGSCPPCRARGIYRCRCARTEEERECCERNFRCGNPCERLLGCGKHFCGEGCHSGPCGVCPFQGKRTCPCGKKAYDGMACDVAAPTCGSTCGKMLSCGFHRCPERCHRGPCLETCRTVVMKHCRCGSLKKEVPCYQDLACERKCQRVRDCGRHACRRRCCGGDCPPCSEICGRKLRCNNHKCPSPCHSNSLGHSALLDWLVAPSGCQLPGWELVFAALLEEGRTYFTLQGCGGSLGRLGGNDSTICFDRGPCAPCPIMVTISCFCGETHFEVPCGTEAEQKPPRCPKLCSISSLCRHRSNCKPHRCHYGACPPCRLLCEEEYPCGHKCKLRCHGPKPAPNPEFTLKPKKKKSNQQTGSSPGSPCPPCPELVWRPCLGQHIGEERMMVCSDRTIFACQNLCGNLLRCGNHYCTKPCHALKGQSTLGLREKSESCEECDLTCQKERKPACPHPCPQPCHVGDCSPCKALIKRSCHCGSMVHVFECTYYNCLPEKEQLNIRSCGGPCHRKLPNCTHLCPETCHPGQCPSPDKCCKKVTVRCACQNLKKEWICQNLQAAYRKKGLDLKDIPKNQFGLGLLPCSSECTSKVKAIEPELQIRKTKEVKEVSTENHMPKRRKRRERMQESREISKLQATKAIVSKCLVFICIIICIIAASYYGYKGLLWLSDWMNEVEKQRQRQRFPRK